VGDRAAAPLPERLLVQRFGHPGRVEGGGANEERAKHAARGLDERTGSITAPEPGDALLGE
jgi:hypothetical protein